jgi:hypothetical protein
MRANNLACPGCPCAVLCCALLCCAVLTPGRAAPLLLTALPGHLQQLQHASWVHPEASSTDAGNSSIQRDQHKLLGAPVTCAGGYAQRIALHIIHLCSRAALIQGQCSGSADVAGFVTAAAAAAALTADKCKYTAHIVPCLLKNEN